MIRSVLLATALTLLAAGSAAAAPIPFASGIVTHADGSGFAWELRAERSAMSGIPVVCLEADHSWDATGGSFGNISRHCAGGRVGKRFSLQAGDCDGVTPLIASGSFGDRRIRKLAIALDRRARRVRITLPDLGPVTVRAKRGPRSLRRPVRFAWHVDTGAGAPTKIVAYGKKRKGKRRVVGRWTPGRGC